MSAEELKAKVREYVEEHLPGWACASVSVRVGEIGSHITETLIVLPKALSEAPTSPPAS